MNQKVKKLTILLIFIIISFWAYPLVHGYWGAVYIPAIKMFPKDLIRENSCLFLSLAGSLGSVFCSFILFFPMGYFLQFRPILMGVLLVISVCLIDFIQYPDLVFRFQWFVAIIRIGEYLSLILSACLFSHLGFKLATYNDNIMSTELLNSNISSIFKAVITFIVFLFVLSFGFKNIYIWSYFFIISSPLFFTIYSCYNSLIKRNAIKY